MAYTPFNQGQTPTGDDLVLPIGGQVTGSPWTALVAPNTSFITPWIKIDGYGALLYLVLSDKPGTGIFVEFSDDGVNVAFSGTAVPYTSVNTTVINALAAKGHYMRFTYTNGPVAQTIFRLEVRVNVDQIQPTLRTFNAHISSTSLASLVKNSQEANDGSGSYDEIQRTGNSLNVNVTNQAASQSITGSVEVSNDVGNPLPVSGTIAVSNPDYAKDTTLTSGSQKTQISAALPSGTNLLGKVTVEPDAANPIPVTVQVLPSLPAGSNAIGSVNVNSALPSGANNIGKVTVEPDSANPIPVTAASLPLPTGASTAANQATEIAALQTLAGAAVAPSTTNNSTTVSATTTLSLAMAANTARKTLTVFNTGNGAVSIYFGNQSTARKSRIVTNGVWVMDQPPFTGSVYVKSESTSTVEISQEV